MGIFHRMFVKDEKPCANHSYEVSSDLVYDGGVASTQYKCTKCDRYKIVPRVKILEIDPLLSIGEPLSEKVDISVERMQEIVRRSRALAHELSRRALDLDGQINKNNRDSEERLVLRKSYEHNLSDISTDMQKALYTIQELEELMTTAKAFVDSQK